MRWLLSFSDLVAVVIDGNSGKMGLLKKPPLQKMDGKVNIIKKTFLAMLRSNIVYFSINAAPAAWPAETQPMHYLTKKAPEAMRTRKKCFLILLHRYQCINLEIQIFPLSLGPIMQLLSSYPRILVYGVGHRERDPHSAKTN